MRKFKAALIAVLVLGGASSPGMAQNDVPQSPGLPSGGSPLLTAPDFHLTFSPRVWVDFPGFGTPKPVIPRGALSLAQTTSIPAFPMVGGVLSGNFPQLPDTTLLVSLLYARIHQTTDVTELSPDFASTVHSNAGIDRYDAEFLAQTNFPDSEWAWILGVRLEHQDAVSQFSLGVVLPSAGQNITLPPISGKVSGTLDILTGKAGLAWGVPVTASGNLRLFANGMFAGGVLDQTGTPAIGVVGPDFSVGFQYSFSPKVNLDLRYRAFVEFLVGAPTGTSKYLYDQGPMVSLNINF